MTDDVFLKWLAQVYETGGPVAMSIGVIVVAWLRFGGSRREDAPETKMANALDKLTGRVDNHHETAQEQREKMMESIHDMDKRLVAVETTMRARSR